MNQKVIKRINELQKKIKALPKGYISHKRIGNNLYCYHQWSESGKKQSKYLNNEELLELNKLIQLRKEFEQEVKILSNSLDDVFTLMHLNEEVIDLYIDKQTASITGYGQIYHPNHLPIGVIDPKGRFKLSNLIEWWNDRSIPSTRSGIKVVLEQLNINTPKALLTRCFGLSLSDQYWIKPYNTDLKWEYVNYFEHDFSNDIGELLLTGKLNKKDIDLSSPDNTSVGNLKKRWIIAKGKRVMIKGGSSPFRQEPYNEVIAYKIAKTLGLPAIKYSLVYKDDYPYSECEDFVDKDEDLIPAYLLNKLLTKSNNDSSYTHLIKCAKSIGANDYEDYLNKVIVFDFIIANEDRHYNNFGIIRNAQTLKYIRPTPLFDNGSSFGFNKITSEIKAFKDIESKPFKSDLLAQLDLVSSFSFLDVGKLEEIKKHLYDWFIKYESIYLTKERITAIVDATIIRIDYLIDIINK